MPERRADAVVVGGGAAGLAAALLLQDRGAASVAVLEARETCGGRAGAGAVQIFAAEDTREGDDLEARGGHDGHLQQDLEHAQHRREGNHLRGEDGRQLGDSEAARAARASLGAGYVDATQRRVLRLAARVGLGVKPVHDSGRNLLEAIPGARRRLVGDIPRGQGISTLLDTARLINRAEATSLAVRNVERPWDDPVLKALDAFTVEDFVQTAARDEEARALFRHALLPVFGAETHELSLAWLLYYAKVSGSLSRLLAVKDGAQEYKLTHEGGFGELARRVAGLLRPGVLHCGAPVVAIRHLESGDVRVELADGEAVLAKQCVLAVQPSLYGQITFEPALPAGKLALCEAMTRVQGCYVKVRIAFPAPWWRPKFSGQVLSCTGPLTYFLDDCRAHGDVEQFGLVGFVVGKDLVKAYEALGSLRAQQNAVCEQLTRYFGDRDAAFAPLSFAQVDWTQETWTRGCVPGLPAGSLAVAWKSMRDDHMDGRLHFAGAELATTWTGYVDGAIQAGERAAAAACRGLGLDAEFTPEEPQTEQPGVREVVNTRSALERFVFGWRIQPSDLAQQAQDVSSSGPCMCSML